MINSAEMAETSLIKAGQRFVRDRSGNVAIMTALAMPVILGTAALGVGASSWLQTQRSMQHAADSAVVAAATAGGDSYELEARAVASQYGYVHGVDNVTVMVSNTAPCPSGTNECYSVDVISAVPLFLSRAIGFAGNLVINGKKHTSILASALAAPGGDPREYCVLALAQSGEPQGIRTNGNPNANLGCNVMSNTDAVCNGHDLGVKYGDAAGTSNGCGQYPTSNRPAMEDPYAQLASNIPVNACTGYPQAPVKKKDDPLPASNLWSGPKTLAGNTTVCGDLQLTGDVTVTAGSGAVLIIRNGKLDTNGYTLKTESGSAMTIVFAGGDNPEDYDHMPTGNGVIDIKAPETGDWSGIALYQDPSLTSGVDIWEAGNSPTWNLTGVVYLPRSSVRLSGTVNKASNGENCFVLVVDNLTVNGTGNFLNQGSDDCSEIGVDKPSAIVARGELVG